MQELAKENIEEAMHRLVKSIDSYELDGYHEIFLSHRENNRLSNPMNLE
jgi:hypothetical protein